jgi:DNA-binding NarL/FixJ family response regulator
MSTSNASVGDHMRNATTTARDSGSIVVVDCRRLVGESLVHCISEHTKLQVIGVQNVDECIELSKTRHSSLFMLAVSTCNRDDAIRKVRRMLEVAEDVPTAVLIDEPDLTFVMELLACGVRGCIPTDISLDVAIAALGLIRAGGTFVPAGIVMKGPAPAVTDESPPPDVCSVESPALSPNGMFTARQVAVINELRLGKPNKLIAYTLAMRESTVKVHVRNIMKRIHAKNRTEVAIRANQLLDGTALTSSRAAVRPSGPLSSLHCE